MENILKKTFYTGVGFLSIASEQMQNTIKELADNNDWAEEEGKKVVDNLVSKAEDSKNEAEGILGEIMKSVADVMGVSKRKELRVLKTRIEELEAQIERQEAKNIASKILTKEVITK